MPRQQLQRNAAQSIQIALAHQNAGQLQEAAAIYQQVLQMDPQSPDALHLLGLIRHQTGDHESAIDLISQAIEAAPSIPLYYCNAGLVLVALGQHDVALACYQKALELQPEFAEVLNNIGNLLQDQRNFDEADKRYREAISIRPDFAEAHYNLGNALRARGRLEEALSSYRAATQYKAAYPDAYNNIGVVLAEMGENETALQNYRQALALLPDYAEAHNNYGSALKEAGAYDEARKHLLRALEIRLGYADAYCNLGALELSAGNLDVAIERCRQALSLNPGYAEAYHTLGLVMVDMGRRDEAMLYYQKAIELAPDFAVAYNSLSVVCREFGKFVESISYSEKALALKPDFPEAYINIGNALAPLGRHVEAVHAYREALRLNPMHAGAYSNMLFTMLYDSNITPAELYAESLRFAEHFEAPFIKGWPRHTNSCETGRRLKIGYVSADFRNHAVAYFIELILANHDKSAFEVYCYYNHPEQDQITERMRSYADHWVQSNVLDDEQMVARIQSDGIDILVDLSGHSAYNRLPVFARKPAPVQVTWMGYAGTTGLSAMDYRFTESYVDPAGKSEQYNSENLVYLPSALVAFQSEPGSPDVNALPARTGGGFTFACLNNPSKLNERVIALWAHILKATPDARMMLGNAQATQEKWLVDLFAKYGVTGERLLLQPRLSILDYLALHHQIDLALDPFPYNGGTTTLHSLWMGVPVLAMAGDRTISRVGASIMNGFGLSQFVAGSEDEYFERAVYFAHHFGELDELRHGLRARITANPACSPASYTREVENACRAMWQRWCAQQKGGV